MNRKQYRAVAKAHKTTVKAVKADMQAAIDHAYQSPNALAHSVPRKGEKPTVDEFIEYTVQKTKEKL